MHTLSPTPTHTHTLCITHTHTHTHTQTDRRRKRTQQQPFNSVSLHWHPPIAAGAARGFFSRWVPSAVSFLVPFIHRHQFSFILFGKKEKKVFWKKRKISAGNFFTPPSLFRALNNIRTNGDLRETCALTQTLLSYAREKKNKKDKESRTLEKNRQKFND